MKSNHPMTMVELGDKPLLAYIIDTYNASGIKNIMVVRDDQIEVVNLPSLYGMDNDAFAENGKLVSLINGLQSVDSQGGVIISFSNVTFEKRIVQTLIESRDDFAVLIDMKIQDGVGDQHQIDYMQCSKSCGDLPYSSWDLVKEVNSQMEEDRRDGAWVGLIKISGAIVASTLYIVRSAIEQKGPRNATISVLINVLVESGKEVWALYTTEHRLDIDSPYDLIQVSSFQATL